MPLITIEGVTPWDRGIKRSSIS